MPTTPTYGLRYPGPDEEPNGPTQIQNLAEDTEGALSTLIPDSGLLATLSVTPSTGFSLGTNLHRVIGKKMYLLLEFVRTGADLGPSAGSWNITDTTLGTINDAAKRPVMDNYPIFRATLTSGAAQVNASGSVRITDMHTDSEVRTNDSVYVYTHYPIP